MPLRSPGLLPPSFVPPYLLDRLAQHAGAHASAKAAQTLMIDRQHRGLREAVAGQGVSSGPAPSYVRRGSPARAIHDAEHTMALPGRLVRAEGQAATGDIAADEAYDYLGATYRLYHDIFERDSIDGAGMPLTGSVHYGNDYDNAFWNGQQMVFGDGDGEVMNRFTIAVDIIGHELTHGVIDHESGLVYQGSRARSTSRSATCSARWSSSTCSSRRRSRPTGWWARGSSPARSRRARCARWPSPARPTTTRCSARTRSLPT